MVGSSDSKGVVCWGGVFCFWDFDNRLGCDF